MIFQGSLGALDLKITKIIFRMNFRIFENHRETSEFMLMMIFEILKIENEKFWEFTLHMIL